MTKVVLLKVYDSYNYDYESNDTFIRSVSENFLEKDLTLLINKRLQLFQTDKQFFVNRKHVRFHAKHFG